MRVKLAIPEQHLTDAERKDALDAALESVTRATEPLVARKLVPTAMTAIRAGKLKWKPEPPGDEHFDLPFTTLARGWGDCDDLAPHHAASLRATGEDPGARAIVQKSGPNRWHAVVERSSGSIDDPSRAAGMGSGVNGAGGYVGAGSPIWLPMNEKQLTVAAYPLRRGPRPGFLARVDLPDHGLDWHWSNMFAAPTVQGAVIGAVQTARAMAYGAHEVRDRDLHVLGALQALMSGCGPDELADEMDGAGVVGVDSVLGDAMQVGSFLSSVGGFSFGSVTRSLSRAVSPITHALSPLGKAYDSVSPFATMVFPGVAHIVDPIRSAIETGDPMAVWKSTLIPGAKSGRDFFERNPLGHQAFAALHPLLSNVPGGDKWLAEAAPRNLTPKAQAALVAAALSPQALLDAGVEPPPTASMMRAGVPMAMPDGGPLLMRF